MKNFNTIKVTTKLNMTIPIKIICAIFGDLAMPLSMSHWIIFGCLPKELAPPDVGDPAKEDGALRRSDCGAP